MSAEPTPYPSAGEIVDGKYRIEKMLGEGGMGAVARATHIVLGGAVALKFMNPQFMTFPGAVERFVNEGRASKAIKSDHVLPVSDVGMLPNGTPYLLMECLYGMDLADLVARDGPSGLPIQRAVHFLVQVLRGLQSAHAIGIIHRDMKPSNCFVVTNDGEDDWIKILDFGISKVVQPGSTSLTQTNSALGTPLYMSPEQARSPRDVDIRSDLYSVGVILYELLTGHTPFFSESGEFTEILFQLFTADPPPVQSTRPEIPDELAKVVHKALAREVKDRYSSALELAEALVPFAAPKTLAMVERMRGFKPPSKDSVIPMEGLPTSMAAFSQLQRGGGAGTDVMVHRPTTDVQKGSPVTEILMDAPKPTPRVKTEVLAKGVADAGGISASPELFAMRARPEEALGRTQLEFDRPGTEKPVAKAATGKHARAVSTDLGATVDPAVTSGKRSPLVYAVPAVALVAMIAGSALMMRMGGKSPTPPTTIAGEPPPSALVATATTPPPVSAPPPEKSAPSGAVSGAVSGAAPGASTTPIPAATAPSARPTATGPKRPPSVLDHGLHE